jgi:hypothetical protein
MLVYNIMHATCLMAEHHILMLSYASYLFSLQFQHPGSFCSYLLCQLSISA